MFSAKWCTGLMSLGLVFCLSCGFAYALDDRDCDCACSGQWIAEPEVVSEEVVRETKDEHANRFCENMPIPPLILLGFYGSRVTGSACEDIDWGSGFSVHDNVQLATLTLPEIRLGPCQKIFRQIQNVKITTVKTYKCVVNGEELCRESRTRDDYVFRARLELEPIIPCDCEPSPVPEKPEEPELPEPIPVPARPDIVIG